MTQIASQPFNSAWFGTDLGKYRACNGTYCFYEYTSIPILDESIFKAEYQWLPELSENLQAIVKIHKQTSEDIISENLKNIVQSAEKLGLKLPEAFLKLMDSEDLKDQIPSCTACYFDLPTEITPCPLKNDAGYLIRFLNDQQDVLFWYLYIKPSGEHWVMVSPIPFEEEEVRKDLTDEIILNNTFYCAPSFEAFVYRFWLENEIWFALDGDKLNELHKSYLAHYQSK